MKLTLTSARSLIEALNPGLASEQNMIDTWLEAIKVPPIVAQASDPEPTPMVESQDLIRLLTQQGFFAQDMEQKLGIFQEWLTGHSMKLMTLYMAQRARQGQILQDLLVALNEALKKGVHDRRQHLEAIAADAREHLQNIDNESRELLGVPPRPRPGKWIPLARLVELLIHPDFWWGNNNGTVPCKYLIARIDTRDDHVLLADGDGRLIDIEFLEDSCRTTKSPGMNENARKLQESMDPGEQAEFRTAKAAEEAGIPLKAGEQPLGIPIPASASSTMEESEQADRDLAEELAEESAPPVDVHAADRANFQEALAAQHNGERELVGYPSTEAMVTADEVEQVVQAAEQVSPDATSTD